MPTEIVGTMAVSGGQKQTALLMPGAYPAEKVTYNGGNVDDDLDSLHFNLKGTNVSLLTYTTASDAYVFPYDGYVEADATAASSSVRIRLVDANGNNMAIIKSTHNNTDARNALFVRKGMGAYVDQQSGTVAASYIPLVGLH